MKCDVDGFFFQNDESQKGVDKINQLLENLLGISDVELGNFYSHSI